MVDRKVEDEYPHPLEHPLSVTQTQYFVSLGNSGLKININLLLLLVALKIAKALSSTTMI